ncbi:unnamed protein product [Bemisia tabaci]|uniref:Peptidase C1A papain C-terminal domain-containing protein n=1 Tax=Bemisia tabaci TaxID=7038 RepID=A0A9P0EZE6_BEMTA|nr:unnamed protein product [Bemisia tabaci]
MYPTGRVIVPRLCVFFMIAQTFVEQGTAFLSDESINRINSAQNSWKAGRNYDLNSEEKIMRLLDKLDEKNLDEADELPLKTKDPAWPSDEEIPKTFDARKKWGKICPQISDIQDQGNCGSSWAVASSSAASDRLCIKSKGKFQDSLSAQHVAFCSLRFGNGCDGGNSFYGWNFLKKSGVVTGGGFNSSKGCQPYSIQPCMHHSKDKPNPYPHCQTLPKKHPDCELRCTNDQYTKSFKKDKHKFKSVYFLPKNVTIMQKDIMTHGPITFSFQVYSDFFNYKSGVYKNTSSEYLGNLAVRALGWGEENEQPYWLIANAWNPYWGDKGLFKVLRGSNHCDIEGYALGGVPRKYKI